MRWIARDCLNRRLRRFSQMGCDASRPFVSMVVCIGDCGCCLDRGLRGFSRMPRPFVSGFWMDVPSAEAPACAGMTVGGLGRWAVMPRAFLAWSLFESGIARVV